MTTTQPDVMSPPQTQPQAEATDPGGRGVAAVVVLAAGAGTRMKSHRSKVLHEIAGRSMLSWAVDAAEEVHPEHLMVVVGHRREQVERHLSEVAPAVRTALQDQQNGTGHAVMCGLAPLGEVRGIVIVTYGDVPMLTGQTLAAMVDQHRTSGDGITVLTARVPDATGYGRIVRGTDDGIAAIVEHKDCTPEQLALDEINSGIYVFDAEILHDGLANLTTDNAQGELYLTDVIAHSNAVGRRVGAFVTDDLWQTEGVNNRMQLAAMNAEMTRRIAHKWMAEGVTIIDPATTYIEDSVELASDVTLYPGTHLRGATTIATGAQIGPDVTLQHTEVGEYATVERSQALFANIGANCQIGPYAYLRPGTDLADDVKVGSFVETKKAVVGEGSVIAHQTYAGDVEIGAQTKIGAGTIFANDDGTDKHASVVGSDVFIGSNSVVVAPVRVADGARIDAGSIISAPATDTAHTDSPDDPKESHQ